MSESSGSVQEVVIKIIRVFVDALPHVPEHRRLPILSQLITTVGGDKFLWVLLVLLFEQYVTKTVTATSSTDKVSSLRGVGFFLESLISFVHGLVFQKVLSKPQVMLEKVVSSGFVLQQNLTVMLTMTCTEHSIALCPGA